MDLPAHLTSTERRRIRKALAKDGGRCTLCGGLAYRVLLWVSEAHPNRDGVIYLLCWDCDRRDQTAALNALTARREAAKEGGHGKQTL